MDLSIKKSQHMVMCLLAMILAFCMIFAMSTSVFAAPGFTKATINDDNGTVNMDSGITSAATMSYAEKFSTNYNMSLGVEIPAAATNITVEVQLGQGMLWVDDGSKYETLTNYLNGGAAGITSTPNVGTVTSSAGTTIAVATANTGKKTYAVKNSTTALNFPLTVALDTQFHYNTLPGTGTTVNPRTPIVATLTYTLGGNPVTYSVKLNSVTINKGPYYYWYNNAQGTNTLADVCLPAGKAFDIMDKLAGTYYSMRNAVATDSDKWVAQAVEYVEITATFEAGKDVVVTSTDPAWTVSGNNNTYKIKKIINNSNDYFHDLPVQITPAASLADGTTIATSWTIEAHYYGGDVTTNTQTYNLLIVPEDEAVYVQSFDVPEAVRRGTLNHTRNEGWAAQFTANGTEAPVGAFYLGNKGGTDSVPKTIEMHFDNNAIGVTGMYLPLLEKEKLTEVWYQSEQHSAWTKATVNLTGSEFNTIALTRASLGMSDTDYITALRYNVATFPAVQIYAWITAMSPGAFIVGIVKQENADFTNSIQIYDADGSGTHDTGIGYQNGKTTQTVTATNQINASLASQTKDAGETFHFEFGVFGRSGYNAYATTNPVLYLKSETGIPFTNLKLTNYRSGKEITAADGLEIRNETIAGVLYTVVDTTNCASDDVCLTPHATDGERIVPDGVRIAFDLETETATPSGTFKYQDLFYVQNPDATAWDIAQYTCQLTDDITGLSGKVTKPIVQTYYRINGREGVFVTSQAKSSKMTAYDGITGSSADEPILMSNTATSGSDIKLTVQNNGADPLTTATAIYVPIPKVGDEWGLADGTKTDFDFSVALKGAVKDLESSGFKVLYGFNVTPQPSAKDLDDSAADQAKFFAENSFPGGKTFADVNCVKIVNEDGAGAPITIPSNKGFSFELSANVAGSGALDDGLLDIWSPLFFATTTVGASNAYGDEIYAQTAYGEVKGSIFNDANGNGLRDAGEELITDTGWKLQVIKNSTGNVVAESNLKANGTYHFTDLIQDNSGASYTMKVINPDASAWTFSPVVAAQNPDDMVNSAAAADDNSYGTVAKVRTYIAEELDNTHGTYDIGVTADTVTTTFTFISSKINGQNVGTLTSGTNTGATVSTSGKPSATVTVPTTNPANANITFSHWATTENGADAVEPGDMGNNGKYGSTAQTYYAVWNQTFNVSFAGGEPAGTATDIPTQITGKANGDIVDISGTAPKLEGYTFNGWRSSFGGTVYQPGDSFTMPGVDITLTAQWTKDAADPKDYSVTYLDGTDDAVITVPAVANHKENSFVTVAAAIDREGYTFLGWRSNFGGAIYQANDIFVMPATNITLTALWEKEAAAQKYTLSYDMNGASTAQIAPVQDLLEGNVVKLSDVIPEKTNKVFTGWVSSANGNTYAPGTSLTMPAGDVVLTAQWADPAKEYTVTYDANGGNGAPTDTAKYKAEQIVTVKATVPTRENYTFDGWKLSYGGAMLNPEESFAMPGTNVILKAQWTKDADPAATYGVTYDMNGADSAQITDTGKYEKGAYVTVNGTTPVKEGFTFTGWRSSIGNTLLPEDTFEMPATNVKLTAQWQEKEAEPDTYNVTYDMNGSTTTQIVDNADYLEKAMVKVSATVPVKEGFTFIGWEADYSGLSNLLTAGKSFEMPATDVTLKAQWQADAETYTVTYDMNGADSPQITDDEEYEEGDKAPVDGSTPTKEGYTFDGWRGNDGKIYQPEDLVSVGNADVVLTAQWTKNSPDFKVSYDMNDADSPLISDTAKYKEGDTVKVNNEAPTKEGYTFIGWRSSHNGQTYQAADTFEMPATDVTLKAQWKEVPAAPSKYKVAYEDGADGVSIVVPVTKSYVSGDTVTVAKAISRNGYTFLGWRSSNGGNVAQAGDTFTMPATNVTMTAQWATIAETYKLTYDMNGSSTAQLPEVTPLTEGSLVKVSTVTPEKDGQVFAGWKNSATNDIVMPGETVTMPNGNVTLTAQWADPEVAHKVTYDANGGMNAPTDDKTYVAGKIVNVSDTVPAREGYTFTGWRMSYGGNILEPGDTFDMPGTDVKLVAQWKKDAAAPTTYNVNYEMNGADSDPITDSNDYEVEEVATVAPEAPTKADNTFAGWRASHDGKTYQPGDTFSVPATDVTLTAQWIKDDPAPTRYTVTYNDGVSDAAIAVPASRTYLPDSNVTVANGIERSGYNFVGWRSSNGGMTYLAGDTFQMPAVNVTLTAQWAEPEASYDLTFNMNGASTPQIPAIAPLTEGSIVKVPTTVPDKDGQVFTGWLNPITGTLVQPGDSITMPAGNVELTAQWGDPAKEYSVTYDANGGNNAPTDNDKYISGAVVKVKATEPTRANYTFEGWRLSYGGNTLLPNDTFGMPAADVTLVAQWTPVQPPADTYNVTYDMNGASSDAIEDNNDYVEGEYVYVAPDAPAKNGYIFNGWRSNTGDVYQPGDTFKMPAADVTLTAQWEKDSAQHNIGYDMNGADSTPIVDDKAYESGDIVKVSDEVPNKNGYVFGGWTPSDTTVAGPLQPGQTFTMPDTDMTLTAIWTKANPNVPGELNSTDHFAYIKGYPDGTVQPNARITRAEVSTIFYRLLKAERRDEVFTTANDLSDVSADLWYNKAVSSMANGKYIMGYPEGNFLGDNYITRAEFATIASRFMALAPYDFSFPDVPADHWAYANIATAVHYGWVQGYPDGTFHPEAEITRAEAMTIINRMLDRGVKQNGLISGVKSWPDNVATEWYYFEVIEASSDHAYTGSRPDEMWNSLTINYVYDLNHYERPGVK